MVRHRVRGSTRYGAKPTEMSRDLQPCAVVTVERDCHTNALAFPSRVSVMSRMRRT